MALQVTAGKSISRYYDVIFLHHLRGFILDVGDDVLMCN